MYFEEPAIPMPDPVYVAILKEGEVRFRQAEVSPPSLPPLPAAVEEVGIPEWREKARSAWRVSNRLAAAITFHRQFLHANACGVTVTEAYQSAVRVIFPEAAHVREVLQALAYLGWGGRCRVDPGAGYVFPSNRVADLLCAFSGLVQREMRALYRIGVASPSFRADPGERWAKLAGVLEGGYDLTSVPVVIPLRLDVREELQELGNEVRGLISLLSRAPETAILPPRPDSPQPPPPQPPPPQPPPPPRMSVDLAGSAVELDGTRYKVTPKGAAVVDILLKAGIAGVCGTKAALTHPVLKTSNWSREIEGLPKQIRRMIELKPGGGTVLRL